MPRVGEENIVQFCIGDPPRTGGQLAFQLPAAPSCIASKNAHLLDAFAPQQLWLLIEIDRMDPKRQKTIDGRPPKRYQAIAFDRTSSEDHGRVSC